MTQSAEAKRKKFAGVRHMGTRAVVGIAALMAVLGAGRTTARPDGDAADQFRPAPATSVAVQQMESREDDLDSGQVDWVIAHLDGGTGTELSLETVNNLEALLAGQAHHHPRLAMVRTRLETLRQELELREELAELDVPEPEGPGRVMDPLGLRPDPDGFGPA
ncbi:MAG: hypothetical protein M3O22_01335 [Pseudomonadota bacterium]|nr:hypothetical protein [Pseudomonadota bacterium]